MTMINTITILMLLLGVAIGLIAGYLAGRRMARPLVDRLEQLRQDNVKLSSERDVARSQAEHLSTMYEQRLADQRANHEQRERQSAQQMAQQMALIKSEMNTVTEKILKERAAELSTANEQQLGALLNPLHENIRQMREAVMESDRQQTVTMERLDASIKENLRQAQEVGERADRLAQALTQENKTQGNFGELRLKQLLEEMGLEEGVQFEEQTTLRDANGRAVTDDDEGHRLVPDVVLHFPDHRDVVIDSKMSFKAFQEYYAAESDEERQSALRRHLNSVRQHVNELSRKNYSKYVRDDRQRLDFVMMYVFSESALQLALTNDPQLWREAYDKGVIIAGSQSLYIMLRVLEMTWRQVRQVENQQEIMKTANTLVERVQVFYERLLKVDEQLHRTEDAFDDLKRSTQTQGMSIATAAQRLLRYGAQENPKRRRLDSTATTPQEAVGDTTNHS